VKRVVVASVIAVTVSCGASRVPATLRGYDILVESKDEQSVELALAMRSAGYHVRDRVKGGGKHTAALIHFTSSEPGRHQPLWFHLRLADTRSGAIVGEASIPLDSTVSTPRARAEAVVAALAPNP
jgi:hypothetical protein